MEPSNWIQERSPRSKGNKYREKYCAEQAEAFALNRHQKLYLLGADCVTFDSLSAPEAENTLARKVSFPFIQSLIMWPDFCLLNLSCSHKVRASRIFFFCCSHKSCGVREVQNAAPPAAAPQWIQTAAEALELQGWVPNCFCLPLLSQGWAAGINTLMVFNWQTLTTPPVSMWQLPCINWVINERNWGTLGFGVCGCMTWWKEQ